MAIGITNAGGGTNTKKSPQYTYTGNAIMQTDAGGWRIRFLTSGTFTITKRLEVDIHCVGGGGSGSVSAQEGYASGGGGGYTNYIKNVVIDPGSYTITVGAGGVAATGPQYDNQQPVSGNDGEQSSFGVLCSANGGKGGDTRAYGGAGGSGGGGGIYGDSYNPSNGGTNGSTPTYSAGGQGTNTYDFGDTTDSTIWELRSGGGGGAAYHAIASGGAGGGGDSGSPGLNGTTNYGGGGGATKWYGAYCLGSAGGSGIVIIRNARGS